MIDRATTMVDSGESTSTARIRRFARPCVWLFTSAAILFALGVLLVAAVVLGYRGSSPVIATFPWGVISGRGHLPSHTVAVPFLAFGLAWRALLAAIELVVAVPIVLILWTMRRLFELYARGIVFAGENIAFIRLMAWLLIAYPFLRLLGEISFQLIAGTGVTRIYLNIASVLIGIGVLFVARVMDLGRDLHNEQAQFL